MNTRPTIEELEKILNDKDAPSVRILPNGEVRSITAGWFLSDDDVNEIVSKNLDNLIERFQADWIKYLKRI